MDVKRAARCRLTVQGTPVLVRTRCSVRLSFSVLDTHPLRRPISLQASRCFDIKDRSGGQGVDPLSPQATISSQALEEQARAHASRSSTTQKRKPTIFARVFAWIVKMMSDDFFAERATQHLPRRCAVEAAEFSDNWARTEQRSADGVRQWSGSAGEGASDQSDLEVSL
jgi:hypothetical protein